MAVHWLMTMYDILLQNQVFDPVCDLIMWLINVCACHVIWADNNILHSESVTIAAIEKLTNDKTKCFCCRNIFFLEILLSFTG